MFSRSNLMLPVALVVAMCLGAQAFLFLALTSSQDRMALQGEHALARTAIEEETRDMHDMLKSYAYWDSAYQQLVLRFDRAFADENLGLYLAPTHGIDYSFVIDGSDRTLYATKGTATTAQTALTSLGAPVVRAIAKIRRMDASGDPRVSGFTRVEGRLALFGVSGVLPSPGSRLEERPGPRTLLILVKLVDSEMLAQLGQRYRLGRPSLLSDAPPNRASLPIRLYGGEVGNHIAWSAYQPGAAARQQLLPALLAVSLLIIALATLAVRIGRASSRELIASEAKARHLAHHDTLTLLPNRRAFMERLKLRKEGEQAGILYLDLDGFKEVNDVFGHGAGDALLKAATERLQGIVSWRGSAATNLRW